METFTGLLTPGNAEFGINVQCVLCVCVYVLTSIVYVYLSTGTTVVINRYRGGYQPVLRWLSTGTAVFINRYRGG
jgi:hypothetical protein